MISLEQKYPELEKKYYEIILKTEAQKNANQETLDKLHNVTVHN